MNQAQTLRQGCVHLHRLWRHAFGQLRGMAQGAGRTKAQLRQAQPFGKPRRTVARLAVQARALQHAIQRHRLMGQGHNRRRRHRVLLLRHGRRATRAPQRHLGHIRAAEHQQIFGHLATGRGQPGGPSGDGLNAAAVAVPAVARIGQAKALCHMRTDLGRLGPQGRAGARSP